MKMLRTLGLLPALLLVLAGCHKKETPAPAPTGSALLAAHAWKDSKQTLIINGYTGTQTVPANYAYTFGSDGKFTYVQSGSTTVQQGGTWQLASSDSQFTLTSGSNSATYQVFTLTSSEMTFGTTYDQATIKQQVAASGSNDVKNLLLSAGSYTFPANTPSITPDQVTSLQVRYTLVPN